MWRSRVFWISISLFLLFPLILKVMEEYWKYSTLGSIQVLAGPQEMWVFYETDHRVTRSCTICSHPARTVGHSQHVLTINENGLVSHDEVPLEYGISFHPNLSTIFEKQGEIYLCSGQSASYRRSVFRWTGRQFELLPLQESESLLTGIPKDDRGRLDWKQYFRDSEWKQGADKLYGFSDFSLDWQKRKYEVEIIDGPSERQVKIRCRADDQNWSEELDQFRHEMECIDRSEFEALMRRPRQEPHPKT